MESVKSEGDDEDKMSLHSAGSVQSLDSEAEGSAHRSDMVSTT